MTFHLKYVAFGLSAAGVFICTWAYEELGVIQMRLIFYCALIKDKYILQYPAGQPLHWTVGACHVKSWFLSLALTRQAYVSGMP